MIYLNDDRVKEDFAAIYDKYYDRVYKYSYTLLLNKEDAEDVTSDTFMAAYCNYSRYDANRGSLGAWLTRIAHNRAVNLMRSAAYSRRADLTDDAEKPGAAGFIGRAEASDTVVRLYDRLDPSERELLNMRCVMELRDREIAGLLGLQQKTVNKRYQRLLKKCRALLSDE